MFKGYFRELAEVKINQTALIFDEMRRKIERDAAYVIMYHMKKYMKKVHKKRKSLAMKKAKQNKKNKQTVKNSVKASAAINYMQKKTVPKTNMMVV